MSQRDITSLRGTIRFLEEQNQLLAVKGSVDPLLEISGMQKALEGGPPLLFENIKDYPGTRNVGNIFANTGVVAKIFGVADPKKAKFRCLEAMKNPVAPRVVSDAPCQEVVITDNVDVIATIPILKHTEWDGGRILGGGHTLIRGEYFGGGSHMSFNRTSFRDKDWASISVALTSHWEEASWLHKGERIPMTMNIGSPPAVMMVAATGFLHSLVPYGSDELAFAGGLQASPVEICKAKTVDTYAIANAEWVLEGYLETGQQVWETDEAERLQKAGIAPAFPEWHGHMGRAGLWRKFQVTAITHQKDRPIFFSPLAASMETDNMGRFFREACFYELAQRISPGLVVDVNSLYGLRGWGAGIVFQVNKKARRYEGFQKQILAHALSASIPLQVAVMVDEDIDIYSADDVLFAITTRTNPNRDIMKVGGWRAFGMMTWQVPSERGEFIPDAHIGIDATAPYDMKWLYERARYPVDKVDLKKWFSEQQIASVQAMQSEYARVLAKIGG
jgi:4-hydroxy-3-polyprenylbenzoate decarboxylase